MLERKPALDTRFGSRPLEGSKYSFCRMVLKVLFFLSAKPTFLCLHVGRGLKQMPFAFREALKTEQWKPSLATANVGDPKSCIHDLSNESDAVLRSFRVMISEVEYPVPTHVATSSVSRREESDTYLKSN